MFLQGYFPFRRITKENIQWESLFLRRTHRQFIELFFHFRFLNPQTEAISVQKISLFKRHLKMSLKRSSVKIRPTLPASSLSCQSEIDPETENQFSVNPAGT